MQACGASEFGGYTRHKNTGLCKQARCRVFADIRAASLLCSSRSTTDIRTPAYRPAYSYPFGLYFCGYTRLFAADTAPEALRTFAFRTIVLHAQFRSSEP